MSRFTKPLFLLLLLAISATVFAETKSFPGVGRAATSDEVKAWDIDVRPDFTGLPKGSGSVAKGQVVWEAKCASCHGTFAESNEIFPPLVGGVTADDIKTGRAKTLAGEQPTRTTLSKLSSVSTLWDYINRAMPWNAPKSLSTEEVYAVVAYLLNLGDVLPADFTLSDANIREVQNKLPNRNGMTQEHGLWDVKGKPDVKNVACMKDCATEINVASSLPDFARNAHGNIAEQTRAVGEAIGTDTTKPPGAKPAKGAAAPVAAAGVAATTVSAKELANKSGCFACHGISNKILGPGFTEVAAKYKGDAGAEAKMLAKVKAGGSGAWGDVPMPPHAHLAEGDIKSMVQWILGGAK